jgi:hypothetical protein
MIGAEGLGPLMDEPANHDTRCARPYVRKPVIGRNGLSRIGINPRCPGNFGWII